MAFIPPHGTAPTFPDFNPTISSSENSIPHVNSLCGQVRFEDYKVAHFLSSFFGNQSQSGSQIEPSLDDGSNDDPLSFHQTLLPPSSLQFGDETDFTALLPDRSEGVHPEDVSATPNNYQLVDGGVKNTLPTMRAGIKRSYEAIDEEDEDNIEDDDDDDVDDDNTPPAAPVSQMLDNATGSINEYFLPYAAGQQGPFSYFDASQPAALFHSASANPGNIAVVGRGHHDVFPDQPHSEPITPSNQDHVTGPLVGSGIVLLVDESSGIMPPKSLPYQFSDLCVSAQPDNTQIHPVASKQFRYNSVSHYSINPVHCQTQSTPVTTNVNHLSSYANLVPQVPNNQQSYISYQFQPMAAGPDTYSNSSYNQTCIPFQPTTSGVPQMYPCAPDARSSLSLIPVPNDQDGQLQVRFTFAVSRGPQMGMVPQALPTIGHLGSDGVENCKLIYPPPSPASSQASGSKSGKAKTSVKAQTRARAKPRSTESSTKEDPDFIVHNIEGSYHCVFPGCDETFINETGTKAYATKGRLQSHLDKTHFHGLKETVTHACVLPGCKGKSQCANYGRHVAESHWKSIKYECRKCQTRFTRLVKVKAHIKTAVCTKKKQRTA